MTMLNCNPHEKDLVGPTILPRILMLALKLHDATMGGFCSGLTSSFVVADQSANHPTSSCYGVFKMFSIMFGALLKGQLTLL